MKNLNLSIPKPCAEKWENFTPTRNGGFCASCNKNVIDFTAMSDEAILTFIKNKPVHACGRFLSHQLKTYSTHTPARRSTVLNLTKAALLSLLFVLVGKQSSAQQASPKTRVEVVDRADDKNVIGKFANATGYTFTGVVKDEYNEPLPGINVILKGSATGIVTDINGWFSFPHELNEGDVLVLSFIGLETLEYTVPKKVEKDVEFKMALNNMQLTGELVVAGEFKTHRFGFRSLWSKVKSVF